MEWIWLGIMILFTLVEAATPNLTTIWFACGALIALLGAAFGGPVWLQAVLFIAVTATTLVFTRPLAKKVQRKRKERTNADKYIGEIGVVENQINNIAGTGMVRLRGSSWTARTENGDIVDKGGSVRVLRIEGVKVIVEKMEDE